AMLLLLIGIMLPTALFRTSLIIEQRLSIKQAQLHFASAVDQRLLATKQRCESDQLGHCACQAFGIKDSVAENSKGQDVCKINERTPGHRDGDSLAASTPWNRFVVDRTFSDQGSSSISSHGSLSISSYSDPSQHNELYDSWFGSLIYWLHHDYNQN